VKTYTRALEDLDAGKLPQWSTQPVSERDYVLGITGMLVAPRSICFLIDTLNSESSMNMWMHGAFWLGLLATMAVMALHPHSR
jgi:hypothetical protein